MCDGRVLIGEASFPASYQAMETSATSSILASTFTPTVPEWSKFLCQMESSFHLHGSAASEQSASLFWQTPLPLVPLLWHHLHWTALKNEKMTDEREGERGEETIIELF